MIIALFFCVAGYCQHLKQENPDCVIRLKVEFQDSGKIGDILIVSNSCNDKEMKQSAIDAAKKIQFEPQKKNGKPISITKIVEYSFTIDKSENDEKADAILKRAVENLGGEKYLQVKSIVGRGQFSLLKEGAVISYQTFTDILVYPDKERTDFRSSASRTVQTNVGSGGWIFDGDAQTINEQNKTQIENYKRGIRTSLDNLLRGNWHGKANLTYVGKRQAGLGKKNDVVKLTFEDGFTVEFEFADDGLPMKALFTRSNAEKEEIKEEDRYAQFVDVQGIKTPFIIDHFSGGQQTSRINYEAVEFNKNISDSVFAKPKSAKELKKDLKF